jgi:putative peptidoglycan lipid II flippase
MRRLAADSALGSVGTLVSRLSGLVRVVVVAAVLGPTQFANLYQSTNALPNLAFELLTGALFVSLVVPALVRHFDGDDRARGTRLAGSFLTLSVAAALGAVLVGIAAGPLVLGILTAGVPDAQEVGVGAAWLLLALLLLQVPLYLVAGMGTAVQNAHGRYALAAAAPAMENVGIIVVMAAYAVLFGAGTPASEGLGAVALLGGGTTAAVLLHAAVQWWGARSCGVRLVPVLAWRDREVRNLVRLAVPSLAYALMNVARYLCILVTAAAVPGGVVAFTLALAFYNLPVALGTRPVAQAALPTLARAHQRGEPREFSDTFSHAFGLALFLTVPAAVGYLLLSGPLAHAVSFGEMASAEGHDLVRACLLGVSLGLVGEAALTFGTQAAYARADGRRPLRAVTARTVLSVAAMLGSLAVFEGPTLLLAIGVSVAVGDMVGAAILIGSIRRSLVRPSTPTTSRLLRICGASLVMAAAVLTLRSLVDAGEGQVANVLLCLAAGTVGATAYLLAQAAMRSPELAGLATLVRRREPAGAPP